MENYFLFSKSVYWGKDILPKKQVTISTDWNKIFLDNKYDFYTIL